MKKWNIGWGAVSKCNMKCQFCYSKFRRQHSKDLGLEDWFSFVDQNHEYINTINYGTGENSLSDDWFTLVGYIREKYPNIRQALTTNGYVSEAVRLDAKKEKIIVDSIDEMDISLDFCDPNKHNDFRGQKHAYRWALDTLEFCRSNGITATIVCLGSCQNTDINNIKGIFDIAEKYDVKVRMNLYRPTEGVNEFTSQFILKPEKLIELLYWVDQNYSILSISDALFSNLLTDTVEADPSGIDSLRILPNGDITPSTYLIHEEFVVGHIKEQNVLQKLNDEAILQGIIHDVIPEECNECKYKNNCKGGVYDRRYLWNNSLSHKDPYCIYTPGEAEFRKITLAQIKFESVHHGYLPTIFFAPYKKTNES